MKERIMTDILEDKSLKNVLGGVSELTTALAYALGVDLNDLARAVRQRNSTSLSQLKTKTIAVPLPQIPMRMFVIRVGDHVTYKGEDKMVKSRFGISGYGFNPDLQNGDIIIDRNVLCLYEDHGHYKSLTQII